jgi:outer membrane protein insertion porin family
MTPGLTQDAIKGVFSLGLFENVEIDVEPMGSGVKAIIRVIEYPKLRNLKFQNNRKIKDKKLEETVTLFEGRLVSRREIKNNIERLQRLYAEKGYLLAEIEPEYLPVEGDPGLVDLNLKISEGEKVRVGRIKFDGNAVFTNKKLRSKMSTKQKGFLRSGSFEREKYLEDKEKIITFYKEKGYLDAVILSDSIYYSDDKTRMFIDIKLREGTIYYFGNFTWEGNTVIADERFKIKVKEGSVYNQKKYDETLFGFYEQYQDQGYWYAQVEETTISRGDTLDFHMTITENDPVHLRLINIVGNTKTREKVIRRELFIKPGMVFKRSLLGRSLREVMVLNFFGDVTPDWDILANGDIDLKIKIEEKPTGQFSVGAGYSERDRFVGTIGLGIPNLLGTGQTATMNFDFGKNRTTFDLSYTEPWLLNTPTSIFGNVFVQDRNWYDWFTERRTGGSIRLGRRLRWPDNYFKIFTGYRLEEVRYFDISESYVEANEENPYSVDKRDWPLTTSAFSLTIVRDSKNLPLFPTSGTVVSWRGELGGTIFGGNWNYLKQDITAEYYRTLFWKVVGMTRARYGEIDGIYHGNDDIPYGERYAPGGVDIDGTIRGYPDGRVGPRNEDGAYLRGRFELIYNLELSIAVAEQQFYVLLFADAGNAYTEFGDIDLFKGYYRSVGPGFRIVIPMIGIMGFDFGYALDGAEKYSWKTHFQIGRGF